MTYRENAVIGLEGLRSHMLRSFLSMLGIIFGVGAVIAMLSIGEGAKQQALEQIQLMGMNNIIVRDVPLTASDSEIKRTSLSRGLTWADARAVDELNPYVTLTVPLTERQITVRYKNERMKANVVGTTPDYVDAISYTPRQGSFFTYVDVEQGRRVCALGSAIKRNLFYFRDPIGEQIKIGDQWYTVIGVMEEKQVVPGTKADLQLSDMNNEVYIPITSALQRYSRQTTESEINRFIARVADVKDIQEASKIVAATMQRRHNQVEDYTIVIPEALLRQSQQTQRIFNIVMGAIAGISLLVGGIGIMNIMLAAVLERTREIGVRRAIGATRKDIESQFLMEAVILSFSGGIVGIVVGYLLTQVIAMYAHWRTIVSWEAILLSFCVSVAVGVVFGVYPAKRAALMHPIDALRYE